MLRTVVGQSGGQTNTLCPTKMYGARSTDGKTTVSVYSAFCTCHVSMTITTCVHTRAHTHTHTHTVLSHTHTHYILTYAHTHYTHMHTQTHRDEEEVRR